MDVLLYLAACVLFVLGVGFVFWAEKAASKEVATRRAATAVFLAALAALAAAVGAFY